MLIRERIRDMIQSRGLKDVAVAARVGMNKNWISTRLTGSVQILAEELHLFATALDVDPCVFLHDEPPQHAEDELIPATIGQRLSGRVLSRLEHIPEDDLVRFFDFLDWQRDRSSSESPGTA